MLSFGQGLSHTTIIECKINSTHELNHIRGNGSGIVI